MSNASPPSSETRAAPFVVPVGLLSVADAGRKPALQLAATLYLPPAAVRTPVAGLIVGHGAGSRRTRHDLFCREACRQGLGVLALDFRGHGDSGGEADGPLEQDLLAAARFLRAHPAVDGDRLGYRGSSMGGFYGVKAAPEAGFAAMVLLCPAGEDVLLDAIAQREREHADHAEVDGAGAPASDLPGPPRWDLAPLRTYFERQSSRALAARIRCPVLLVHARHDEVVPFRHSLLLLEHLRVRATLLALPGGSHTTAQHDPEVHRYSAAWLAAELMH